MATALVNPKFRAWSGDNLPLAFGKVYSYAAGTNIPKPTYTSEDETVVNPNPVILNAEGYADIYLDGSYKIVVKDKDDVEIWTADPVTDITTVGNEWVHPTPAEKYDASRFKVEGNQADLFHPGRRVKLDDTGYLYGEVTESYYSGQGYTIVGVVLDGGSITSNLNQAYVGIIGAKNSSQPSNKFLDDLKTSNGASLVGTRDGRTIQERFDDLPSEVETLGTAEAKIAEHDLDPDAHPALTAFIDEKATDAENAAAASEAARDAAIINASLYADEATGRAAVADGEYFKVVGSGDVAAYEYQRVNASTSTLIVAYPSSARVEYIGDLEFVDYKNYPVFVRNGSNDLSDLGAVYSGAYLKGHIYKAFKSLQLFGNFDQDWIMRIRALWNDTYNPTNHYFRLIIERWDGAAWIYVFDTGTIEMTTLGWANDETVFFEGSYASGARRIKATIDLSLVPVNVSGLLNSSTDLTTTPLLISKYCVVNHDADEVAKLLTPQELNFSAMQTETTDFRNDYFSNVWARYLADISTLDNDYLAGYKRKLKYQAFKSAKLYGFDKSQPLKLAYFWVDSYNPTQRLYRIILQAWDGASWVEVYDAQGQKGDLGIVDGKSYLWDQTDPATGKRMVAEIDFSNLAVNDGSTLNPTASEPEFVFAKSCFYEIDNSSSFNDDLLLLNASKPYFNSRRKPTFAFIWDDLNASDSLVYDIFREYGFLPSFALKTGNLNSTNAEEYKQYYLRGCSILAHSVTHPIMSNSGTITSAQVETEMADSKAAIESYGMKVSGWVTPSSALHVDFLPLMEKYFGYGFTLLNAGYYNETVDPIKMNRYGIESNIDLEDHNINTIKARIDTAISNNELLVFYGHKLPSTYLDNYGQPRVNETDLRNILSYLRTNVDAGLCQVLSCDEAVYQYYKQPWQ